MNIAIILAGGIGARLGKGIPKQFVKVLDKPIMAYTLEKFENNNNIDAIEIVTHKDYMQDCMNLVNQYGISKVKWYTNGGSSFPESTVNGLNSLKGIVDNEDVVLIHSSCSPLVTDEVIDDAIRVCKKYGNAMAIQQMCFSTCLKDDETCSSKAIDRESIVQVQFPLSFKFGYITDVYDQVYKSGTFENLGLHLQYAVFSEGGTMHFSKGDDRNMKITTQAELDLFEGYLLLKESRRQTGEK